MVITLKIILPHEEGTGMNYCVMLMHMTECIHQGLNMEVVAVEDHFQINHKNMQLNQSVTKLTS